MWVDRPRIPEPGALSQHRDAVGRDDECVGQGQQPQIGIAAGVRREAVEHAAGGQSAPQDLVEGGRRSGTSSLPPRSETQL